MSPRLVALLRVCCTLLLLRLPAQPALAHDLAGPLSTPELQRSAEPSTERFGQQANARGRSGKGRRLVMLSARKRAEKACKQLKQYPQQTKQDRIPKIVHQVYLSGEEAWLGETQRVNATWRRQWRESCKVVHPHWRHMFWDMVKAEKLLQERYPWFLPTFRGYSKVVYKGDALRPFLLHAFGGVYFDIDVECFRNQDSMLRGFDLVLQSETKEENEVVNAVMASVPGHPYWEHVFRMLPERAAKWDGENAAFLTGPQVTTASFYAATGLSPGSRTVGEHVVNGTAVKVYPLMHWFTPCEWNDHQCHVDFMKARGEGIAPFTLVGYHRYAGTWMRCNRDCEKGRGAA